MRFFLVTIENDSILLDGKEQRISVDHLQAALDYWGVGHKAVEITCDEGSRCPDVFCTGTLELPPVEGCSCHISAPCHACVENVTTCNECGLKTDGRVSV